MASHPGRSARRDPRGYALGNLRRRALDSDSLCEQRQKIEELMEFFSRCGHIRAR